MTITNSPALDYLKLVEFSKTLAPASAARAAYPPYQYLIAHGKQYTERRPDPRTGPPKQCFQNAFELAQADRSLRYVEGVACGIIPVDHAWCVTAEGIVIDPTWSIDLGSDYYGVEIPLKTLYRLRLLSEAYSVFSSWWCWPEILKLLETERPKWTPPST